MNRLVALTPALLVGCGPALPDDLAASLTEVGGCGDIVFYAHDVDDTVLLRVAGEGLVDAATAAGEPTTTTFTLPDAALEVEIDVGSAISDAICDDVIVNGGPRVRDTWIAVSGTAEITVRPGAETFDARSDLHLEGVSFDDPEDTELDTFDITDISVGWFAG